MKTIPILLHFDSTNQIGMVTIDETKLPPGAEYCFVLTLGFRPQSDRPEDVEITSVSIQTDKQYTKYLEWCAKNPWPEQLRSAISTPEPKDEP